MKQYSGSSSFTTATYTEPEDEKLALGLKRGRFYSEAIGSRSDFLGEDPGGAGERNHRRIAPAAAAVEGRRGIAEGLQRDSLFANWRRRRCNCSRSNQALQDDIAKRRKAEEELRWKTAFLEAEVDSSNDGILVIDSKGKKILQNQRMNELWKIPAHIAEDRDDAAQVAYAAARTKKPAEFLAKIKQLAENKDAVSEDEIELVDGTILDRLAHRPVREQGRGNAPGESRVFRHTTEHRKLEGQFRQSQKMEAFSRQLIRAGAGA